MPFSHRNIAEEQKDAYQKTQHITAICQQLSITLDPIDWQTSGIRAWVTVNTVKIAELLDLSKQDSDSILRRVRIKLLEQAALETIHPRSELRALIWSPVDVVQPQEFLTLWILTMETDERIAVAEYIRNGQRVYEHYALDMHDRQQLASLFGPVHAGHTGVYQIGDTVTIGEHARQSTGTIIYILPPGKASTSRKNSSREHLNALRKTYTNDVLSRYLIDCNDGFPHIVNQWQIVEESSATGASKVS